MKFDIDLFKIGYQIVCLRDRGFLSDRIFKTQLKLGYSEDQAKATHVGTYVGKGKISEAVFPNAKESYLTDSYAGRSIIVVKPKVKNELYYDIKGRYHIALASNSRLNIRYGLVSLLWYPLHVISKSNWLANIKWLPFFGDYCSLKEAKAVAEVYPRFWDVLKKPIENIIPADFLDPNLFKVVWFGKVPEKKPIQ